MTIDLANEVTRVAATGAIIAVSALISVASVVGALALIREFWRARNV
jgi:hypothetical protein